MDGEIAEILAAFGLGQPFPIAFMLEIWEIISPFVQTDIDRSISVAHFEIIGDRVGCESIDVRLNASDNQIVKYVSIECCHLSFTSVWNSTISMGLSLMFHWVLSQSATSTLMPLCKCTSFFLQPGQGMILSLVFTFSNRLV